MDSFFSIKDLHKEPLVEMLYKNPLLFIIPFSAVLIFILTIKPIITKKVKKYSTFFIELCNINNKYHFHNDIPAAYQITHYYKSKQALEHADPDEICGYLIYNNSNVNSLFEKLSENRKMYIEYNQECKTIIQTSDSTIKKSHISKKKFRKIEKDLQKQYLLKPIQDISININLEYISPKGKSHYRRAFEANYDNLLYIYSKITQQRIINIQAQIERAKMSASLRYDVLKRDGFKCTICGASTADGIKLHVDHIILYQKVVKHKSIIFVHYVTDAIWEKAISMMKIA